MNTYRADRTASQTPSIASGSGRRRALWLSGALLSATLAFTGCAAGTTATSGETTASATASSSTTTDTTATETASTAASTADTISVTATAAEEFLATLSEEQQEQVLYAFDDETKTTSWSNFPVTFVERAGLNLTDLTEEQQAAALNVLENLLSDEGYETVTNIIGGDEFLLDNSSTTEDSLGQYYIAFFGEPSETGEWSVQFGGHHLGLNASINGEESTVTFAPTHLGSQPVVYTDEDGNEVATFANFYETAFAFYDSLSEEQLADLYQGEQVQDLECAPGGECDFPTGTGLSGADLTDEQKQLLLDVIANWVGLADDEYAADELAAIEETLDETYINWSGAIEYNMDEGEGIYFQISGPKVFIEFANQQGSAGADIDGYTTAGWGHVHTIYRDPTNDYANSVEQQAGSGMGGGPGAGAAPGGFPGE